MFRPLIFKVAILVIALDQITKWAAVAYLEDKHSIKVLGSFLKFSFTRNPGAAFSIGTGSTFIFSAFAIIVSSLIIWQAKSIGNKAWAVIAGGFLGGALGNLIDRIVRSPGKFHGHVVDWIMFPNFPLFNLADTAVVLSAVFAVLLSLRGIDYASTPESEPKS